MQTVGALGFLICEWSTCRFSSLLPKTIHRYDVYNIIHKSYSSETFLWSAHNANGQKRQELVEKRHTSTKCQFQFIRASVFIVFRRVRQSTYYSHTWALWTWLCASPRWFLCYRRCSTSTIKWPRGCAPSTDFSSLSCTRWPFGRFAASTATGQYRLKS